MFPPKLGGQGGKIQYQKTFQISSQEAIERLEARIKSEDLKELSGFPIKDIQILNERSDDKDNSKLDHKWRLVAEIARAGAVGRDLRGVDLSDADLSDTKLSGANLIRADLSGADLSGADLIRPKLSDADLSGANLIRANLIAANLNGANLSGTNLSGANLSGANLNGAKLSDAKVKNARFAYIVGIDESTKLELIQRGAIF
ncbi:pentapeptide repeat-containing protein [Moorena producens JHB]|uniref:Pentapeptide repeat-containing protein n=1 Tax=Moorena producens (strain JHB) TaxID=1454205 RepID=A0A1D9G0V8_MOOP1|nr:pentapeptide repeat-containing protein [Moorena producens]AOY81243.2 pentapeptide repeat-containing protein [Moorena producens JHB]